ncbi:hypothetical protein [Streptomyces sp. NPDC051738]|uniref:hypothetical protein n=1 Tax=Streptomyces sp. NPDC051738 TaxID=3365672 RepID=UPI0037D340A3
MQDDWQEFRDALADVKGAVERAEQALRRPDHDADGASALDALFALDDTLIGTRDLALKALPRLLAEARPGKGMAQATRDLTDELTAAAEQVKSERAALEELAAREEELRRRAAECERLRSEAEELRKLEGLAAEWGALQAQREVIDARLRELRDRDLGAADRELYDSARTLLQLTEPQLAVLEQRTRQTLEQAAAAQEELAVVVHELSKAERKSADLQDQLARIQEKHSPVFASLDRHAQADRQLAQALREAAGADNGGSGPERDLTLAEVEALMGMIEDRLKKADETLRDVLAEPQDPDGGTKITGDQP